MELRLHMVSHTGEMPYKVSSACLWHSFEWLLQPGAAGSRSRSRSRMPFYSGQPGPAGRCCTGGCGSARGWFFSPAPAFSLVPELIAGSLPCWLSVGSSSSSRAVPLSELEQALGACWSQAASSTAPLLRFLPPYPQIRVLQHHPAPHSHRSGGVWKLTLLLSCSAPPVRSSSCRRRTCRAT